MNMPPQTVWIIDDDQSIRWVIDKSLQKANFNTVLFESAAKALIQLKKGSAPNCILCDVRMPGIDGFAFLKQVQKQSPELPIIIMTAYSDLDTTVEAYQGGAFEYLPKPFDINEVVELTHKACLQHTQNTSKKINPKFTLSNEIIGESPALQDVFRVIGRLSKSNISVLIEGETGTGKELVAKAIHLHSPRAEHPFISINTASIPLDALESELFGFEENHIITKGKIEQAEDGSLFFDEIGDLPLHLQTRLLRVLNEGEVYRVASNTPIKVNVRIIAATHHKLKDRVDNATFHNDLFHQLNAIRLHLPPLRDRKEDIPLLLNHFLQISAKDLKETTKKLNAEVSRYLSSLNWSGNVRQLQNVCRWLTVMATGNAISMSDLPEELSAEQTFSATNSNSNSNALSPIHSTWHAALADSLKAKIENGEEDIIKDASALFERTLLQEALKKTNGRKQEAARIIGWGRNTITRKIKELGL